jgi:hypothetical protein
LRNPFDAILDPTAAQLDAIRHGAEKETSHMTRQMQSAMRLNRACKRISDFLRLLKAYGERFVKLSVYCSVFTSAKMRTALSTGEPIVTRCFASFNQQILCLCSVSNASLVERAAFPTPCHLCNLQRFTSAACHTPSDRTRTAKRVRARERSPDCNFRRNPPSTQGAAVSWEFDFETEFGFGNFDAESVTKM